MARKTRQEEPEEEEIGLKIKGLTPAPAGLFAVFDDGSGDYEHFPVLMFSVIDGDEEDGDVICGLISSPDGLDAANLDDDFIGFWLKDTQDIHEFLADHGHGQNGGGAAEDDEESDDD